MMNQKPLDLSRYRGFLLDVDGVLVSDREVIPGAVEAVAALQQRGKVVYLSNNSALSRASYAAKLNAMGFSVSAEQMLVSSTLVARYLTQQEPQAKVLVIGGQGLKEEITLAGHALVEAQAGWLATGMDRKFNYETLNQGLQALLSGARWVASGADATYPTPQGLRPGAGSMVGAFRGMGFEPEAIVGKPSRFCMEQALELLGISNPKEALMIGDRLDTDILGAQQMGMDSLLVLTGVTQRKDFQSASICPTFASASLSDVIEGREVGRGTGRG
ncbi:MAG TPA: HAD-IIA family hydrolase [Candidatus Bipolaricaulota bacterium]